MASNDIDIAATLRSWQAAGDEHLWKFVVSPEHAANLDLREHARELVGHMRCDLDSRLEWVAIDHYNTDNPHVHLLVRGRDLEGRSLRGPRDYLASGLRQRSQELATQRLGLRSDREILAARAIAAERTQYTELDRTLLRRADDRGIVSYHGPVPRPGPRREMYTHELRRLQFLENAGLAEKVGTRTWRLSPGMETTLRQAQLLGDITKSRAQHIRDLSDPRMPLVVTQLKVGGRVTGRLVARGWTDRLQDRRYVMIEATDGRLHYIPTGSRLEVTAGSLSAARRLVIGDLVTLTRSIYVEPGRQVVRTQIQAVELVKSIVGISFSGRLLGYGHGHDKQRYALVDVGREVWAAPAGKSDIAIGRKVRAKCSYDDHDPRRRFAWQLASDQTTRSGLYRDGRLLATTARGGSTRRHDLEVHRPRASAAGLGPSMYLLHTPEIPQELRDGAVAGANRWYTNYVAAVNDRIAGDEADGSGGSEPTKAAEAPA